jgi:hypothetical protein
MKLTQAVHRHEHSIQELLREVACLKAQVELLRSELSYLRPIQPMPIQPAPLWPDIPLVTCCATGTGGSA